MNRVFVLILIALLQLRQFPCDCRGEGLVRSCDGNCSASHLDPQSQDKAHSHGHDDRDDEIALHEADHNHHEHAQPSDDELSINGLRSADHDHSHSHPTPLCRHTSAARSIDRVRQTTVEFSLQPLGLTAQDELLSVFPTPSHSRIASIPEICWRVSTRQALLCCWLI